MTQSTSLDHQSHSHHGQPLDPNNNNSDQGYQQLLSERNALRAQNDQLWKIIEKQRVIIQNLQKDVAKVTSERDQLRQSSTNGTAPDQYQQQSNGQSQYHSKRSMERRVHETESNLEQLQTENADRESEQASGFNPNSSFSSISSLTDHRQQQQPQQQQHRSHQEPQSPRHHAHSGKVRNPILPLTPSSSNFEGDFDGGKAEIRDDESMPNISSYYGQSNSNNNNNSNQGTYDEGSSDSEIQVAVRTTTQNHGVPIAAPTPQTPLSSTFNVYGERDHRIPVPEMEPAFSLDDYSDRTATPPRNNISGSINIAPHLMPHLPPRSPRRERKEDVGATPEVSDNEDDQPPLARQKSAPTSAAPPLLSPIRARGDYSSAADQTSSPLTPLSQNFDKDQDGQVMPVSKISIKQANAYEPPVVDSTDPVYPSSTPASPAPTKLTFQGSRKMVSGPIPIIPTAYIPQNNNGQDQPPSSPSSYGAMPVSPIATIIDKDAEKFRVYMNKFNGNNNGRKGQDQTSENQDHAVALGQAVAMENIQTQIELLGQTQGGNANNGADTQFNPDSSFTLENNREEQSNVFENRGRRRNSTLPTDTYPKITARSTSHYRDENEGKEGFVPPPPKRYDSQPAPDRSTSPIPSGSSQNSGQAPTGFSSSRPQLSIHQQAFHMFGDSLDSLSLLVVGGNFRVNDKNKELMTFTISIGQETQSKDGISPHKEDNEFWRVEKQFIDFVNFDSKLRITQSRNVINNLPRLPDKNLFNTNAPSKNDARKAALEQYLQLLTSIRIKDTRDFCEFLNTNLVERVRKEGLEAGWKEGYLTKRGKNFGGWKTRFFVLRGPVLEYFDTKDGHHLGSIALTYAQIGRQQTQDRQDGGDGVDPNSYRHAFLILEPKKGQTVADAKRNPNNVTRHVLCADSDEDRDEWVNALLVHIGKENPADQQQQQQQQQQTPPQQQQEQPPADAQRPSGRRMPEIQKVSATPIRELASVKGNEKLLLNQEAYERQQRSVPQSPPAQFHSQSSRMPPQSPGLIGSSHDDRHSNERKSAENQYPGNVRNNYGGQYNDQDQQAPRGHQQYHGQQHQQYQHQQSQHHQHQQQQQYQQQQQQQQYHQQQHHQQSGRDRPPHSGNQGQSQDDSAFRASPESQPPPSLTPAEVAEKKKSSRMTFHWPKKAAKEDPAQAFPGKGANGGSSGNLPMQGAPQASFNSMGPSRQVFGVSLEQAVDQARIHPGYELPAVVYRCIEYLNAHNAKMEEGIYRLNGSAAMIKSLKDRFNNEGDVTLLTSEEYYDIHAVAGLLKLFLRDLPSSVLTRDLHKDFLQVIELPNRADRVNELARLVSILPETNYTILRALTAHLIEIVENADVNKMTVRNVGIVFSPTLGIPAGVFALLMSDFDQIFHTNDGRIMPLEVNRPSGHSNNFSI